MGRKGQKKIDLSGPSGPQGGSLTHNPFAALGSGRAPVVGPKDVASQPQEPSEMPSGVGAMRIEVRFERKGRGGKAVSVATWLGPDSPGADELTRIARGAAKALGAGAKVEDGTVVVQGRQVERLADHLESTLGAQVVRGAV